MNNYENNYGPVFFFYYCPPPRTSQPGTPSNMTTVATLTVFLCFCALQGVEGASAAAHALSLPADAYGNDVSGNQRILWSVAPELCVCVYIQLFH